MTELNECIQVVAKLIRGASKKIVGYAIKNIGREPINIIREEFIIENRQQFRKAFPCTMAPGQTVCMAKDTFIKLMAAPEFSFKASNGVVYRTKQVTDGMTTDEIIDCYSFRATCTIPSWQADRKIKGQWKLLPEYISIFGE